MKISADEIIQDFKETGILQLIRGGKIIAENISSAEDCKKGDLVFVDNKKYIDSVLKNSPSVVITNSDLKDSFPETEISSLIVASNLGLAHALIRQKYADRNFRDTEEWGKVHPNSVVHPTAKIHESVIVGPCAVIGKNVFIGKNSVIMANVVIEYDVKIGEDCILYPGVYVGYECIIGNRVTIKPGSIIGSEGYGFAQDKEKKSYRIPQTGKVILEDDVLVGANNCIDRAAYGQTIIGNGTKMDNLCHIAHNVQTGKDCLLTAGLVVAGSTKIGNRMIASGQAGILDHLTIADDVVLVQRAGVTSDIKEPGIYAGLPTLPLSDYMKTTAIFRKLPDLKKEISDIKKRISDLEKK
ncbi:MAG: UDP-3-O-(3-hydroxymyristoyl)glucosamine N-acyltransferase [Leptospiraceae bacterium]|nr:UDP-3-O-(3-hydroxymyristoyl)glucosamine N-acyltransferase [Leptospiraceae bacterium]MCK6381371.1 UDP-3-O-(3-hydroxymyristoyl)glucosamine N-acyltransferase [Leptospiraceae bacterium]NUM42659.1 UDP-3-O-(3-hydroxymyristoyl)glucosamine N-acyltransferase [Leptospiraceae bacterium]